MRYIASILPSLAMLTHIFNCFDSDRIGFLIFGFLLFPLGIIHGWYIWYHWVLAYLNT